MKKVAYVLFMFLICVSAFVQASEQYRIHIIDKLIFQNNTPFDIEDLEVKIQDPMAYTTSKAAVTIKIPSEGSADLPILSKESKKEASRLEWQFNERILRDILLSFSGSRSRSSGPAYAVHLATQNFASRILPLGFHLDVTILGVKPIWCSKDEKREKCKGNFVIQKDSKTPYKFIISQAKPEDKKA